MKTRPLVPSQHSAVQEALRRRGVEDARAHATATGLTPLALVFDQLPLGMRERLAGAAHASGIDCITGDDWALCAGGLAKLAGLARRGFSVLPDDTADAVGRFLRGVAEPPTAWVTARGTIPLDRTVVAGILNVTPDSFSDGGQFLEPGAALDHAERMVSEGAMILDVGAESTRPGRRSVVDVEEEWRRLEPVIGELGRRFPSIAVSVDTTKAEVARRALDDGAWIVNDVSGTRNDPAMAEVCAAYRAGLVLMHSRGAPPSLAGYGEASYDDLVGEVVNELADVVQGAIAQGVRAEAIAVDPGLGFAKRPGHNLTVLQQLRAVTTLGHPVMVGPSRKRFLTAISGDDVAQRDDATAAACAIAAMAGAAIVRVHAVARTRLALDVADAVRSA